MRQRLVMLVLVVVTAFLAVPREQAYAAPAITTLTPTTGSTGGGTLLTIYGSGFLSGAYVSVGGVLSPSVTVQSSSQLTALTPPGVAGAVQVVVINPDGLTAFASGFTYTAATTNNGSLWVAGINPPNGSGGQIVNITGSGFDQNSIVFFGGVQAPSTAFITSGYLMSNAPFGLSGSVSVQVVSSTGASGISPTNYTYTGTGGTSTGSVTISSVSPTAATAGGALVIYGSGFVNGASVNIGGYLATGVAVVSPTLITANAPAGPSGSVTLTVTNPDGTAASFAGVSYGGVTTGVGGQPSVSSVSPSVGSSAGGTVVSINGSGFIAPATVTFGGVPATSVTVVSSYLITATTPPNPVGTVSVLVAGPAGSVGGLTSGYTYELAWPRVTSVSPSTGALVGGTTLTITGSGFAPGATVTINGQPASTVSAVSPTQIIVTTPAGPPGSATLLVTNPGGAISGLASAFAYSANPQAPVPSGATTTISGVTPSSGPSSGGTAITILGSGFLPGATVTVGGVSVAANVVSSSLITATTPAVTGTGNVSVSVANPGSSAFSLPSAFAYTAGGTSTGTGGTGTGGTSSPVPSGGGLFVFGGGSNAQLLAASGCSANTAVFWTTNAAGAWIGYIPSVPVAIVNATWTSLFPNGIPAGTPIYARC